MREITFKYIFFNVVYKKYVKKIFKIKDLESMDLDLFVLENTSLKFHTVLQSTGLKDADGTEIYEGDFIKLYYITPFGDIANDLEDDMFEVEFSNGAFGYQTETKFIPLEKLIEQHDGEYIPNQGNKVIYGKTLCKVIGNIYEDKDLG